MNAQKLGRRLKAIRLERGESQLQVAKALGVTQPVISLLEAGKREPRLAELRQLAEHFGLSLTGLLWEDPKDLKAAS